MSENALLNFKSHCVVFNADPFPKQGIIKASMKRLSKVRPGGTCANPPVRGNWCSFKSGKMVQDVREFLEKSGNLKVRHGWPPCKILHI